jgi:hypothetical protein
MTIVFHTSWLETPRLDPSKWLKCITYIFQEKCISWNMILSHRICTFANRNNWLIKSVVVSLSGPPREILQGGTRLIWDPWDKLRRDFSENLRIWGPIKQLEIFFLNKLKIVENMPPKKSLVKAIGALQRFTGPFLALRDPDRCISWTPFS